MSISSIVPIRDREEAIQDELKNEGKPMKTRVLTKRVLSRFASKLTPAELDRVTPSGYPWWPGCIRLDLNRLQNKGIVRSPNKGYWEIDDNNIGESTKRKLDKLNRQGLNLLAEALRGAKSGQFPFSIKIKDGEFTLRLEKDDKKTRRNS
jgi:hypothetical protein